MQHTQKKNLNFELFSSLQSTGLNGLRPAEPACIDDIAISQPHKLV